jgi:hypothetical protein
MATGCGTITIDNTAPAYTGFPIKMLQIQDETTKFMDDTIVAGRTYLLYVVYHGMYPVATQGKVVAKFDGVTKYSVIDPTGPVPPGADRGCVFARGVPGSTLLAVNDICVTVEAV